MKLLILVAVMCVVVISAYASTYESDNKNAQDQDNHEPLIISLEPQPGDNDFIIVTHADRAAVYAASPGTPRPKRRAPVIKTDRVIKNSTVKKSPKKKDKS